MTVSFATFDRLKSKGVAAYQRGDYITAKTYLTDAAECMIQLAEEAESPETQRQHEELAAQLIDLAKDCDKLKKSKPQGRRGSAPAREGDDDDGGNASDWIVRDKPQIGFNDIAGLEDVKQEIRLKMLYPFAHQEHLQQQRQEAR
ncbi:MAG: hypothetical protein ACPGXK_03315 [Phycisphaerae bacterium]